jgi:hypothetical protein
MLDCCSKQLVTMRSGFSWEIKLAIQISKLPSRQAGKDPHPPHNPSCIPFALRVLLFRITHYTVYLFYNVDITKVYREWRTSLGNSTVYLLPSGLEHWQLNKGLLWVLQLNAKIYPWIMGERDSWSSLSSWLTLKFKAPLVLVCTPFYCLCTYSKEFIKAKV